MSLSSYDDLLKQVESLKAENGHLRAELQDNSSHLTKLETEASTMKNVLSHLHTAMEEEESKQEASNHQEETLSNHNYHTTHQMDIANSTDNLDQNSNSSTDDLANESNWNNIQPPPLHGNLPPATKSAEDTEQPLQQPPQLPPEEPPTPNNQVHVMNQQNRDREARGGGGGVFIAPRLPQGDPESPDPPSSPDSPKEAPKKKRTGEKGVYAAIQALDIERNSLLQEIENEDKHRKWYYDQLEGLEHKIHGLPITDNYNLQADMTRRQLEFEIQRIQEVMKENLGTNEEISARHEARIQRIHMIETEMLQLQHRHRQQLEQEKVVTCSRVTTSTEQDASIVLETANKSTVSAEVSFVEASYHELQGDLPEGTLLYNGPNGSKLVTIATQTADQLFPLETGPQFESEQVGQVTNQNFSSLYHGAWPIDNTGGASEGSLAALANQDTASVMSFHSNNTSSTTFSHAAQQQLGTKVEMVYSLLSMLGTHDKDDMSRTLLAMSSSQDSCIAMRQSGCLPLLIQLLHGSDKDSGLLGNTRGSKAARARAAAALHNIVHSHPDDKRGRREARVLRLLEQIRAHCDQLRGSSDDEDENGKRSRPGSGSADIDHHPGPAIAALMKLSFDEEHRHAICTLGGLQAIAELLQLDHEVNSNTLEQYNITMRRYACMALTNLTFGDGTNKALLCSMKSSMRALVAQLQSPNEDLRQVAASVLRNLSWRADLASKKTLREVGSVTALMHASMDVSKESTLKSILSALWNLSAHCSENKADICAVEGSLAFLVTSLTFKSPSKTLSIIENGGGILRNVSSHIAVREDYRKVLRHHNCLQILLKHLRSPSLTIVSNACGTLWNLSARCLDDQKALWEMGAVSMLRNLVHSKHKMISMGSAAALKNLLSARPNLGHIEGDRLMPTNRPGLHVRKQRALEAEIDQNLAETCENLESPTGSPTETRKHDPVKHKFVLDGRAGYHSMDSDSRKLHLRGSMFTRGGSAENTPLIEQRLHSPQRGVSRSGSQDSVGSTHSDISHDRSRMHSAMKGSRYSQDSLLDPNIPSSTSKGDTSPRGGSERNSSSGHSQGSRIAKVMQEVVQHAGIDNVGNANVTEHMYKGDRMSMSSDNNIANLQRSHTNGSIHEQSRISMYKMHSQSFSRSKDSGESHQNKSGNSPDVPNPAMTHSADRLNLNYTGRTQRMERLHLNLPEPEQDEPINYSMKYPSEPQRQNNQIIQGQGSAFAKPIPKVQNFVGGKNGQFQRFNGQSQNNSTEALTTKEVRAEAQTSINVKKPAAGKLKKNYSGYAETDLDHDNVDQPTDFSLRYLEPDEEHQGGDKPINYSTHYKEPDPAYTEHQCKEKQRPKSKVVDQPMPCLDEDTVRTFCTEGTPLTFLSTATSMNDLSGKLDKEEAQVQAAKERSAASPPHDQSKGSQFSSKYADSEKMSGTGTHSTERNTSSTVIVNRKQVNVNNTSTLPVPKTSPPSEPDSHPPSMYSYNDSTSTSSPSDKPRAYCTEGTPMSFSRRSSLSSLHSGDAHDSGEKGKGDVTLQNIDDGGSLDVSINADVTLKPEHQDESFQSANTSGQSKTVTFDENNQVQETPLMFSRCSSLGSLSSFDAHSVHSSVISEYSRRASEVVSPSELPDSPSDTMPPSPSHRKSPVRFVPEDGHTPTKPEKKTEKVDRHKAEIPIKLDTIPEGPEPPKPTDVVKPQALFKDNTVAFADEGSPPDGNFSSATSLSALTFDDEPNICKDPGMRRVPLGQETDPEPQNIPIANLYGTKEEARQDEEEKEDISLHEDEDNSSVSEGEENLLAECINLAMPTSSKKKIKKSSSDGGLKQKSAFVKPDNKSELPMSASSGSIANRTSKLPMPSSRPVARLQGIVQKRETEFEDRQDSPRKFATEGTPLNYSRAESLSDLSMESDGINETMDTVVDARTRVKKPQSEHKKSVIPDDNSDLSSLSDEDEDLLSVAIEAAMPKSGKKKWKTEIDRKAEGSDAKGNTKHQKPGFRKPNTAAGNIPQKVNKVEPHSERSGRETGDYVKTYAVEGTPINFSRATSLSDLTVDDMLDVADGASEGGLTDMKPSENKHSSSNKHPHRGSKPVHTEHGGNNSFDSPYVFGVEGTPMTFSRNDSLSDLSCDEEAPEMLTNKVNLAEEVKSASQPSSPKRMPVSPKKHGMQPPAMSRLKTPSKSKMPYGPSSTSTPLVKKNASPLHGDEHTLAFATEGTPMCFSRNSSLSSLHSDEQLEETVAMNTVLHPQQQQQQQQPQQNHVEGHQNDCSISYKVEDTPAHLSGNSSLSALSLSVESLSFDPTPSESALLEECINAAMPKSKKKKDTLTSRSSPSGSSDVSSKRKSPRAELFGSSEDNDETEKGMQSKNGEGPQAEVEMINIEAKSSLDDDKRDLNSHQQAKLQQLDVNSGQTVKKTEKLKAIHHQQHSLDQDGNEVDPDYEDEKLMEAIHDVESKVAEFDFRTEAATESSICLEARKLPQHLLQKTDSAKMNHSRSDSIGCRTLEFSTGSSDMDLMKESFPDMSSSLVSNVTTPDQEDLVRDTDHGSGDTTLSSRANLTVINLKDLAAEEETNEDSFLDETETVNGYEEEEESTFNMGETGANISVEEEKALEENANIILSELSFTRDLSTSIVDDDFFIENETISLVSNDYCSDTASEVSVSLSSSSKAPSEQASETSSASTLSSFSSVQPQVKSGIGKPRFFKPGTQESAVQKKEAEGPAKGIRGGKKLASAAIRGVPNGPKQNAAKTTPPKAVRGGQPPPKTKTSPPGAGRGSGITPPKKTVVGNKTTPNKSIVSPGGGRGIPRVSSAPTTQTRKSSPARGNSTPPKTGQVSSPKSSPKLIRRAISAGGKQITPPKAVGRGTGIPTSSIPRVGGAKTSPRGNSQIPSRSRSVDSSQDVERPAPPVKQGTFTKDSSPTENAPKISPDTSMESTDHNGNRPNEKRQIPSINKSPSGASVSRSNSPAARSELPMPSGVRARDKRASGGTPPQRNSPPVENLAGDSSAASTPPKIAARRDPEAKGNSPNSKANSRTSLNKTSSGSSLNKTGSSSSLNKSTNNNNTKTPLKRGDSTRKSDSALPRRGSASSGNSRSTTPQGRSVTPNGKTTTPTARSTTPIKATNMNARQSTPSRKNSVNSVGSASESGPVQTATKKPATSKIASLWRKDNPKKVEANGNVTNKIDATEEPKTKSSKGPKSPKTNRKFSKFGKSKKEKSKISPTEESKDLLSNSGLKRSSTYDKLVPDTLEVANQITDVHSSSDNLSVPSLQSQSSQDDSQKNLWRRTYTIPSDEFSSDACSVGGMSVEDDVAPTKSKSKKEKRHSLSIWKKHSTDTEKTKDSVTTAPKEPPKKKGFSLWRRDPGPPKQKDSAKNPSPGASTLAKDKVIMDMDIDPPAPVNKQRPEPPRRLEGSSLPMAAVKSIPSPNNAKGDGDSKAGMISVGSPLTSPSRNQAPANAAIVAPFNYNPNQKSGLTATDNQPSKVIDTQDPKASSPNKHLTKTEMLIARRRQSYLNSLSSLNKEGDSNDESSETKRSQCLVTTV